MKPLFSVAAMGIALVSAGASATVSDAEFAELKAQFATMAQRLNTLETQNSQLRELSQTTITELEVTRADLSDVQAHSKASSWSERIKWKGDFRYRYEEIDVEDVDTRERNRIRARAALIAALPMDVELGLGIATGGDDPVSTNQTLGGGGSTKDVRLDLGYFKWNATDDLYLQAGKYSNPLFRPQKSALLWDGDWRPEGISAGWSGDHLFASFLGNWLESDSNKSNNEFAWGIQGGTKFNLGDASLTAALAYFDFPAKGNTPFFGDDFFGNSSVDGLYEFDYEMIEISTDLSMNLFDMPLSLFADYVQNQDPDDYDTAWLAGVKLGKAKGKGTWQLAYQYQDTEADSVLGLLSDSDFAGGGTDGKGHRLTGAYGINKQWNVAFTWYINNEAGEKNLADRGGALDYDRLMIDTVFKY